MYEKKTLAHTKYSRLWSIATIKKRISPCLKLRQASLLIVEHYKKDIEAEKWFMVVFFCFCSNIFSLSLCAAAAGMVGGWENTFSMLSLLREEDGWQKGHEEFFYSFQGHFYEILKDYINLLTYIVENSASRKRNIKLLYLVYWVNEQIMGKWM